MVKYLHAYHVTMKKLLCIMLPWRQKTVIATSCIQSTKEKTNINCNSKEIVLLFKLKFHLS